MFADTVGSANDNDDMQIRCSAGLFTPSNKRSIKGLQEEELKQEAPGI